MKVTTDTSVQPQVPQQAPPQELQAQRVGLPTLPHVVLQHTAPLPQPPHLAVQPQAQAHRVRTIAVILCQVSDRFQ